MVWENITEGKRIVKPHPWSMLSLENAWLSGNIRVVLGKKDYTVIWVIALYETNPSWITGITYKHFQDQSQSTETELCFYTDECAQKQTKTKKSSLIHDDISDLKECFKYPATRLLVNWICLLSSSIPTILSASSLHVSVLTNRKR